MMQSAAGLIRLLAKCASVARWLWSGPAQLAASLSAIYAGRTIEEDESLACSSLSCNLGREYHCTCRQARLGAAEVMQATRPRQMLTVAMDAIVHYRWRRLKVEKTSLCHGSRKTSAKPWSGTAQKMHCLARSETSGSARPPCILLQANADVIAIHCAIKFRITIHWSMQA